MIASVRHGETSQPVDWARPTDALGTAQEGLTIGMCLGRAGRFLASRDSTT